MIAGCHDTRFVTSPGPASVVVCFGICPADGTGTSVG